MPLLIVVLGIVLLLALILIFKLNSFLAFVIVSLAVALAEGMSLDKAVASIEQGIGNTLGLLVMILGLGAMLGKLVADSGAAQRITSRLVDAFGIGRVQLALMLTAFIVGVPLFYDVGFVIMMPIVFAVAAATGVPLLYVGLPTLASLSVTHGYLPPHPAPTAIATMFQADIGKTLLYGIVIAIPAIIVAGPILSRGLKKVNARPLDEFTAASRPAAGNLPGVGVSIVSALLPVLLIGLATIATYLLPASSGVRRVLGYAGNPPVAMLVSLLLAIYTLGLARGRTMGDIMASLSHSISSLTMVMLIIAGAGALKQVLVDSGVSAYIGQLLSASSLSPLFLGWLIATDPARVRRVGHRGRHHHGWHRPAARDLVRREPRTDGPRHWLRKFDAGARERRRVLAGEGVLQLEHHRHDQDVDGDGDGGGRGRLARRVRLSYFV